MKPYIFIQKTDCVIIYIFLEKGQKLIPAKSNSTEKTQAWKHRKTQETNSHVPSQWIQTVREASKTASLPAEYCENLSLLFAVVSLWERHRNSSPRGKKIRGTVNNNPQIMQMGKHFQNWLYKVLLTSHKQARWGEYRKEDFYLSLNPGQMRQERNSQRRDYHGNGLDGVWRITGGSWGLSHLGHSPYSRGNRNSERLSGWPCVSHFPAKPILESRSPVCQSSAPATVAWPSNWIYDRTRVKGTRWGS